MNAQLLAAVKVQLCSQQSGGQMKPIRPDGNEHCLSPMDFKCYVITTPLIFSSGEGPLKCNLGADCTWTTALAGKGQWETL